jgi:hypothetical protein
MRRTEFRAAPESNRDTTEDWAHLRRSELAEIPASGRIKLKTAASPSWDSTPTVVDLQLLPRPATRALAMKVRPGDPRTTGQYSNHTPYDRRQRGQRAALPNLGSVAASIASGSGVSSRWVTLP